MATASMPRTRSARRALSTTSFSRAVQLRRSCLHVRLRVSSTTSSPEGNTIFDNGTSSTTDLAERPYRRRRRHAQSRRVSDNYMYYPNNDHRPRQLRPGLQHRLLQRDRHEQLSLASNVLFPQLRSLVDDWKHNLGAGLTGLRSPVSRTTPTDSSRPTGKKSIVRPNQYESGRANITIFNWDNSSRRSLRRSRGRPGLRDPQRAGLLRRAGCRPGRTTEPVRFR